jgi:hypothetical protein
MSKLVSLGRVTRETKGSHINENTDGGIGTRKGLYGNDTSCKSTFVVFNDSPKSVDLDLTPYVKCGS